MTATLAHTEKLEPGKSGQKHSAAARKYIIELLIVLTGLALSLAMFRYVDRVENEHVQKEFEQLAATAAQVAILETDQAVTRVRVLHGLFLASTQVEKEEFLQFAQSLTHKHGTSIYQWVPRVTHAQRAAFEKNAFMIRDRLAGDAERAADRAEYFPVLWNIQQGASIETTGLDVMSDPDYTSALELARDTGNPALTAPLSGLASKDGKRMLMLFIPYYGNQPQPASVADRRQNLKGYIGGAIDPENIGLSLQNIKEVFPMSLVLLDRDASGEKGIIYTHGQQGSTADGQKIKNAGPHYSHVINIGGRSLAIEVQAHSKPLDVHVGRYAFFILSAGLIITVILSLLTNITRQRLARERMGISLERAMLMEKNEEVERASRFKSEFLANISHEIRTPMNGVIGMAEVLMNTPLDEGQKKMLSIIRDSGNTQLGILNDILDFSKIEAGKLELSNEPFSMVDTIEKICMLYGTHAEQKQVQLSYSTDNLPKLVEGDPLRVRQVLSNFVSNAIKFSSGPERHGQVLVQAGMISEEKERIWIEISVKDNGIGMDDAALSHLFSPFTQADRSTTKRFGGTGLGLVISRRLVEMMGGNIRVESVVNAGSVFTAAIPFLKVDEAKWNERTSLAMGEGVVEICTTPPIREQALRQGRLLLVAEDNETNQEVIRQQLAMLGYAADIVGDGMEAFECWLTGQYKVVISDLHMPKMDGYRLTSAIREQERKAGASRTVILALTANALRGEADHCIAIGMDDYLSKPVPLPELGRKLEQWLSKVSNGSKEASDEYPISDRDKLSLFEEEQMDKPDSEKLPVWDAGMLGRMIGDNQALQKRLIEKFLSNAQAQSEAIQAAAAAGDIETAGKVAHALKSAARTIGAMQLGELCQELETAAKGNKAEECRGLASRLENDFKVVAELIKKGG
ncbi:MAG: ATP-binding protein [Gallionellaceae bacterium]|nr:ATP-binding protein [Gallionellaceae bacterium]